ncbi:MAG: phosphatase PAP2 family protein [Bacteroidales bacterium]
MIEFFDRIDKSLLLFLNGNGTPYWDDLMWIYTGRWIWVPVALGFIWYFFRKGGWREAIMILLSITLLITLCDQISSSFFKPFFERLRPSHQEELQPFLSIVNGYRGGRFGFISSHAANSIGFATFTALVIRRSVYSVSIFLWALLTCYSRIYLGVHFPGDILAGSLLGVVIGYLVFMLYQTLHNYLFVMFRFRTSAIPYERQIPWTPLGILYGIWLVIFIFPTQLFPYFIKH